MSGPCREMTRWMLVQEDPDGSLGADWGMHAVVAVADDEVDNQDQDHTADAHMDKELWPWGILQLSWSLHLGWLVCEQSDISRRNTSRGSKLLVNSGGTTHLHNVISRYFQM
jgi:hypothetical protein